jgi:hypothetical protein
MATQSRNLEGKGAQRARRWKGTARGRETRHGCYSKGEPLFKGRFPRSRLEASRARSPPMRTRVPTYDMGARPHMSYKRARSAKKANRRTGSVQPPYGCTPSHLRRNQRSRRRTAIQGACNCPAVIRPTTFTATSGQGGEPPHKEHATAPRLCAPRLRPTVQPLAWGPRPT